MMLITSLKTPSYHSVHFSSKEHVLEALGALRADDIAVSEMDGAAIRHEHDLFEALSRALLFPKYFGMNWDALDDCLRDLDWLPARGYVVVLCGGDQLWRRNPQLAGQLIASWLFAGEQWVQEDKPFHLVFAW